MQEGGPLDHCGMVGWHVFVVAGAARPPRAPVTRSRGQVAKMPYTVRQDGKSVVSGAWL